MEELKLIIELLGDVSQHAAMVACVYMVLQFFKAPVIIATIGYFLNKLVKNVKVVKQHD